MPLKADSNLCATGLTLVTGSAGRVGKAVCAELNKRRIPVRGFDRVPTPDVADAIVGTITDPADVRRAMTGVTTLIHLAACPDDVEDVSGELLPANINGLYQIMEAARAQNVRRYILASSGQVNWWHNQSGPWPIDAQDPISPKYWYAATKMFMESIGRGFHETHGASVIIARLGWCPRTKAQVEEIAASAWAQDVYLSPGDAGRFFACCVEAPESLTHTILYATSRPLRTLLYDLETTRKEIGWEPLEHWPQGIDIILNNSTR